ncbi:MAG: response regulator, partial [Verrucomicrobiota bacterium]
RTPMNGILGFSSLLKEPGLSGKKQLEYISIIEKSGTRMLNIINDIVDISKIESGLMEVSLSETNINEQIDFIYKFFKESARQKGLQLYCKNELTNKESIIYTDREKVYAILINLVKNAIKFTDVGSIEFGYEVVETSHDLSLLQFYVKDTGIGIPKDRQSAIFDRFVQADISDIDARQGAGLGLTISKAFVEMLGGKIWLVSNSEVVGSTFYFTLPFYQVKNKNSSNEGTSPKNIDNDLTHKLKILIVENDELSELFLRKILENSSLEILTAYTGREAITLIKNNPDIDLIMMDIKLRNIDGYEATALIRLLNRNVIIIAQTAYALSGDKEKAIEAGCNDYISKPIDKDELLVLLMKYFPNKMSLN